MTINEIRRIKRMIKRQVPIQDNTKSLATINNKVDTLLAHEGEVLEEVSTLKHDGILTSSIIYDIDRDLNKHEISLIHIQSEIKKLQELVKAQAQLLNAYAKKESISTQQLDSLKSQLSKKDRESLHVGPSFNMAEQPPVQEEGGVHKVSPIALSVNGAVILHDIGYTTDKKNLIPLYFDPITGRVIIYHGK